MTFPQIPLGDDGELDIEDSREFPALHISKPKRGFLKDHWPYFLIGLYPLMFIGYRIMVTLTPKLDHPFEFDEPINYQAFLASDGSLLYVFIAGLVVAGIGLLGLLVNDRYSWQIRTLTGLGFVGLTTMFSCWLCGLALSGYGVAHIDTLTFANRHYHLAMATENSFGGSASYFLVFECQSDDTSCRYLPDENILSSSVMPREGLALKFDEVSRALYIGYGEDILYLFDDYVDENSTTIGYPRSLSPLTPSNVPEMQELARIPHDRTSELLWSNDGSKLLVFGSSELQWYGLQNGEINPRPNQVEIENYTSSVILQPLSPHFGINSADGGLMIFDRDTLSQIHFVPTERYSAQAISPNGNIIVLEKDSYTGNTKLQLWGIKQNTVIAELPTEHNYISSLSFSADNHYIAASVGELNDIKIWSLETFEEVNTLPPLVEPLANGVGSVIFEPFGHNLTLVLDNDVIKTWNVETSERIRSLTVPFSSRSRNVMAYSPDGRVLVSIGNTDNGINLWDTQAESHLNTLPYEATTVAFNPDGTLFAFVDRQGYIHLWGVPKP